MGHIGSESLVLLFGRLLGQMQPEDRLLAPRSPPHPLVLAPLDDLAHQPLDPIRGRRHVNVLESWVTTMTNDRQERTENRRPKPEGRLTPPGRIRGDDSIDASSEDTDRTDDGYRYSAGYDSQMATRIGAENEYNPDIDRLRAMHEGCHQSDGEHSLRESQREKRRISQALCSSLPISDHEGEKVVDAVESLNFDCFGNQKAIPRVTLGVVAVRRLPPEDGDDPNCRSQKDCYLSLEPFKEIRGRLMSIEREDRVISIRLSKGLLQFHEDSVEAEICEGALIGKVRPQVSILYTPETVKPLHG